jgi:transketolase
MNNMGLQLARHLAPNLMSKPAYAATRDGYGHGVVEVAKINDRIAVLCCDLTESTRSHRFRDQFPDRFIEVGVAEQNMAGIAAGMATEGYIPFIASYAVFSPGRNWDQIRVSVCYSNTNVKIMGAHAGVSVGPDGATHQALEDIAIMRVLPNMVVLAPCDEEETRKAIHAAAAYDGPVYVRFAREKTAVITTKKSPFAIGKASVFVEGTDVTIVACGPLLYEALHAAQLLLKAGVHAEVINMPSLKPFDEHTLLTSVRKTRCVVTVEEHQIIGGLFGAVAETLAQTYPVPIIPVGMHDSFGQSGTPDELLQFYGMRAQNIFAAAHAAIKKR